MGNISEIWREINRLDEEISRTRDAEKKEFIMNQRNDLLCAIKTAREGRTEEKCKKLEEK